MIGVGIKGPAFQMRGPGKTWLRNRGRCRRLRPTPAITGPISQEMPGNGSAMEKGLIITYLLTNGGAAFALFNPFVGLLVYVAFAILRPESLWHWSVPEGNYSRIVAIALLIGWVLKGFGNWDFRRAAAVVYALIGFLLWSIVGAAFVAEHKTEAWEHVEDMAKIVLPVLVGITTIDSMRQIRQLAWVILLSVGYISLEFNLSYVSGENNLRTLGFG